MNDWFNTIPVRFELVKNTARRELAFLKPVSMRGLNLFKIDALERLFELVNYDKTPSNMYISVAKLDSIPKFTYNRAERGRETSKWFRGDYYTSVIEYDLFMDFDRGEGEDWGIILQEIKQFKDWLDLNKLPYYMVFSGKNGFQIIIPYKYLPQLHFEVDEIGQGKEGSIYQYLKKVQESIKEVFSLKHLDLSNNAKNCPSKYVCLSGVSAQYIVTIV